jgi:tetratricopeptide (TPR) repeat protein
MLRSVLLSVGASLALAGTPGSAADPAPLDRTQALAALEQSAAAPRRAAADRLGEIGTMADSGRLVARLRDDDEQVRALAASALWRIWSRSGDAQVDALFQRGVLQMSAGELEGALATFSEIIARRPAFAEGWNKRATVYYLLGRYERSLKDCDEVLKRNPNHFGALSGYGEIYVRLGNFARAVDYFKRALAINPNMPGVAASIPLLEKARDESRRQMI